MTRPLTSLRPPTTSPRTCAKAPYHRPLFAGPVRLRSFVWRRLLGNPPCHRGEGRPASPIQTSGTGTALPLHRLWSQLPELDRASDSLQVVNPAANEAQARLGKQPVGRSRYEHLPSLRERRDPGDRVHGDPADVVGHPLDLSRVDADPQLDP